MPRHSTRDLYTVAGFLTYNNPFELVPGDTDMTDSTRRVYDISNISMQRHNDRCIRRPMNDDRGLDLFFSGIRRSVHESAMKKQKGLAPKVRGYNKNRKSSDGRERIVFTSTRASEEYR